MITVDDATRILLEHTITIPDTIVPLEAALGRLLREDLIADRDFPPFDRVTMDGIAIRHDAFAAGRRNFLIETIGAAGAPQTKLNDPEGCIEIMTGAILPEGTDTVIRYEDVTIADGRATVNIDDIKPRQNVHRRGIDRLRGSVVVPAGRILSAPELGVAATVGKHQLRVAQFPPAIIISSGDELVDVQDTPLPHQIRKSNEQRLRATLQSWGIPADTAHLLDEPVSIRQRLGEYLERYDIIIMSGGVSEGKFDYMPQALDALGVRKVFHKIRQRPGKPFWFGVSPRGARVFALPGNPVSSFMCTLRYVRPWMEASLGLPPRPRPHAVLAADIHFTPDLTYFAQVRLEYTSDGRLLAHPVEGHGSGDLANLVDADAFIELPRGKDLYKAGEVFGVWGWR